MPNRRPVSSGNVPAPLCLVVSGIALLIVCGCAPFWQSNSEAPRSGVGYVDFYTPSVELMETLEIDSDDVGDNIWGGKFTNRNLLAITTFDRNAARLMRYSRRPGVYKFHIKAEYRRPKSVQFVAVALAESDVDVTIKEGQVSPVKMTFSTSTTNVLAGYEVIDERYPTYYVYHIAPTGRVAAVAFRLEVKCEPPMTYAKKNAMPYAPRD